MDDYKIAFIHSSNFEEKGLIDGSIEFYGEMTKDSIHAVNLLNYAQEKFPNISIFKKLTIKHQPEIISYFFTKLGIIVFLNMTKYDEKHLRRYGRSGMLMLPDELTEKQKDGLEKFTESISDFDILINYDLSIDTGILSAKTIQGLNKETPSKLLRIYFKQICEKDKTI